MKIVKVPSHLTPEVLIAVNHFQASLSMHEAKKLYVPGESFKFQAHPGLEADDFGVEMLKLGVFNWRGSKSSQSIHLIRELCMGRPIYREEDSYIACTHLVKIRKPQEYSSQNSTQKKLTCFSFYFDIYRSYSF